ncbi:alginate lyase family protein [Larkinella ripae]
MKSWQLYWNTIRYLRLQQVLYQVANRVRSKPSLLIDSVPLHTQWLAFPPPAKPWSLSDRTFTFLNQSVTFSGDIDWNYGANGKLWQYNLNYFDFLNQVGPNGERLPLEQGLGLIREFMRKTEELHDSLEPYPVSLRIMNWIRFLSHHQLQLADIDTHLRAQVRLLENRLEYHLLGNHLLENGFALLTASLYFQDVDLYEEAINLVRLELNEQLCDDGGHYERSPMYHQILLDRLLDCCFALRRDAWHQDDNADSFLLVQAHRMLGWLEAITFADGSVPLMNDAANGIAPTTDQIRAKARLAGIEPKQTVLSDSGFRRFRTPDYELVANVGAIGPTYQPGHAHADTFSFVLHVRGRPLFIDAGTSTYETNARRQWERSTAAHNTVQLAGVDSSEVWGGFRVGRRADVTVLEDKPGLVRAQHDGYRHLGAIHERSWEVTDGQLTIVDTVRGEQTATARFYLAPGGQPLPLDGNRIRFPWGTIRWENALEISQKPVRVAQQFNRLVPALVIEVQFKQTLKTLLCAE